MTKPALAQPKAFLSYSWYSEEYAERVEGLACDLMSHGVDVVLDQWHNAPGQDLNVFMEQAVDDPTVSHVLILCDPDYADKADGRRGGVGKETLIISPRVYEDVKQKRVIPVILDRDTAGKVVIPTYLIGRRYIDLSTPDVEAKGYEDLVRQLFNRPSRVPPTLGTPPAFLQDDYVSLRTTGAYRLFRAVVLSNKGTSIGIRTVMRPIWCLPFAGAIGGRIGLCGPPAKGIRTRPQPLG